MGGFKYTPGPWKFKYYSGTMDGAVIVFPDGSGILTPFKEEDARLIAAAPDLLEALKDLAGESKETFSHWPDLKNQVDAAIAKAEGR